MSIGSFFQGIGNTLSGNISDEDYAKAPQVGAVDPNVYQIPGFAESQARLGDLYGQVPTQANFSDATADRNYQTQMLQQYLQQAQGLGPSPALGMLAQAQNQNVAQQHALALSNQAGSNPALGMRNVAMGSAASGADIAGKGATLRSQEQLQGQQLAGQMAGAMRQADAAQAQNQFLNQMAHTQAQADIEGRRFSQARQQTDYNVEREKNRQMFEMYMRQQYLQRQQEQARATAQLIHAGLAAAGTVGGGLLGMGLAGPVAQGGIGAGMGMLLGSQMGGQLGNFAAGGGGGGGGGMDPMMMQYLMNQRGGGGGAVFNTPMGPASGSDINTAYGYGRYNQHLLSPAQYQAHEAPLGGDVGNLDQADWGNAFSDMKVPS